MPLTDYFAEELPFGITAYVRSPFSQWFSEKDKKTLTLAVSRARSMARLAVGCFDRYLNSSLKQIQTDTLARKKQSVTKGQAVSIRYAATFIIALMKACNINTDMFIDYDNLAKDPELTFKHGETKLAIPEAHFHHILSTLKTICTKIHDGLKADLDIVDLNGSYQGSKTGGYVRSHYTDTGREYGRIHLDFALLSKPGPLSVEHIILHEASHKFASTKDVPDAYIGQANYDKLSPYLVLTNADHIATIIDVCYNWAGN